MNGFMTFFENVVEKTLTMIHFHIYKPTDEIQTAEGVLWDNLPLMRMKELCRCGKFRFKPVNISCSVSNVNNAIFKWV